jgi:hypothetical protein
MEDEQRREQLEAVVGDDQERGERAQVIDAGNVRLVG